MKVLGFAVMVLLLGCDPKAVEQGPPTYAREVGALLAERCAECHGPGEPDAGYIVTSYLDAIYCVPDGSPAVLPEDASAPILAALSDENHTGIIASGEFELLLAWVEGGAVDRWDEAHPPGFTNPRSPDFHGTLLRAASWDPLYDTERANACGRCHEGAPARPADVGAAPTAPDCTTCHDRPEGALDCATCHGQGERAHPPRDECFFGDAAGEGAAHAGHEDAGIDCAECHGERDALVGRGGLHGNGAIEIAFGALAGEDAAYDPTTRACAVYCHQRGGNLPAPSWTDPGPLECQSCHQSPPADHYAGACQACHAEANADGTALSPGPLHLNGVVDVGDGSGGCGACHGAGGDDAWPRGDAHDGHRLSALTTEAPCETCHVVPTAIDDPGHLDGVVQVELSGLAAARGVTPRFEDGACAVACHGEGLLGGTVPRPVWDDREEVAGRCDACHGVPPAAPHPAFETCAATLCHGGEVTQSPGGPRITEPGRLLHIDGVIDAGGTP